jgi:hypothetical protein
VFTEAFDDFAASPAYCCGSHPCQDSKVELLAKTAEEAPSDVKSMLEMS